MKFFTILILLSSITIFSSCKKLTQFDIDYTSQVVIPSSSVLLVPFAMNTPPITTNSSAEFEANDTDKKHIKEIKLSMLNLTITSPSNETFSFLNSISIFIKSPMYDEVKIAHKTDIPSNIGTELVCDIVDMDLQEFVKDDNYTIRVEAITDETIPQDVNVDIYSKFRVNAKIFK